MLFRSANIRSLRLEKNIAQKEPLTLHVVSGNHNGAYDAVLMKMCNLTSVEKAEKDATAASFLVGTTEYAVPLGSMMNVEEEIKKIEAEMQYLQGFLKSVMGKLNNERFVANAKAEIVENERKKQADAESKLETLKQSLESLKSVN